MKPPKQYVFRHPSRVTMRELEAGDHVYDHGGRELPFVPGDLYVQGPFQNWVLASDLAVMLYEEADNGDADHDRERR